MSVAPALPRPDRTTAWHRNLRDLDREHGFEPLRVEGRLPPDLQGTLYRNGPSLFSAFGRRYRHWFDGDGAVSAVRLGGGRAEGAVKVVQSRHRALERRAGKPLFGGYGTRPPRPRITPRNAANTSVMVWEGRVLALFEGGRPTELSPEDLSTLGETDLGGAVVNTFSAHPRATSGATWNFGVRYGPRTELDLYELRGGVARRAAVLPLSGATMIHDFVATESHLVFFAPPLRMRMASVLLNLCSYGDSLAWRPGEGTEILVVPIADPGRATRFTVDPFFQWHLASAFERGGEIVVDLVRYADFTCNAWLGSLLAGPPRGAVDGGLCRTVIDPAARSLRTHHLAAGPVEFPRVHPGRESLGHRLVWLAGGAGGMQDRVVRADMESGRTLEIDPGPHRFVSEPVPVPKANGRGEDAVWVLVLVYDGNEDSSHLAVIDGEACEVVARAHLDHPIPHTFHGVWEGR